jgi:putative salt-induced outer membrane protein
LTAAAAPNDPPKTDGRWRGDATVAFSASSGTSRNTALLVKADLARLTEVDKITLAGSADYARSTTDDTSETTSDKFGLAGQYDRNLGPRLFAFGRLTLDRDGVTDLDLRSTVAGGMGWKLKDTQALQFSVFGGVGYTQDRYGSPQTVGGETGTRFSRANLLLGEESVHALSPTVSFKQRLELLPGLSGDRSNLLKLTADLGVALNSTMRLSVGLVDTYDSRPPLGQKSNQLSVFTGLSFRLGDT